MLILLPPSEGKTSPAAGPKLDLAALSFPELNRGRTATLKALIDVCAKDPKSAASILGLGPTQADEVRVNALLRKAACAPAIEVYTGVLFDALDVTSLGKPARRRLQATTVISSALFGLVRPDDIVIIGAHFDSIANRTPGDPSATNAPGADDNASGTAGVLEIASVLSRYQFAQTIRFIGFNAEEQGMIGSQRYAQAAEDAGDNIVAMVDLDMIGYVNDGAAEDLDIMGNGWLVDLMVANVKAFTTLPVTGHVETPMWSDHQYFAAEEYPGSASVMAIEFDWDENPGNPYYHQIGDTAATLNYPFALEVSRGAAATVIDLAELVGVPAPPVWVLLVPGLVLMRRWSRPGVRRVT